MGKRLPDEVIVAALMGQGSVRAAANQLGVMEDTLYKRMKKSSFKEAYTQAKADCLKTAAAKLQANSNKAVDTLVAVMENDGTAANTRVYCADQLLKHALKYSEAVDIISRLEALEREYEK